MAIIALQSLSGLEVFARNSFVLFCFPILKFTKGIQVELGIALDYGDRRVGIDFPVAFFCSIFFFFILCPEAGSNLWMK